MSLPDFSADWPDLSDTTQFPVVDHAPSCTDPSPATPLCFGDALVVVRPFAWPTTALGQLSQPMSRLRSLLPVPPSVGTHCPSPRIDLDTANAGNIVGDEARNEFWIKNPDNDACLPIITPLLQFPCTGITADTPGSVTMVDTAGQASLTPVVTKNDGTRFCSTDIQINANIPCVVPTVSTGFYDDIKSADSDTGAGTTYSAAQAAYTAANTTYTAELSVYTTELTIYTAELAAYTSGLVTYATAYAAYEVALQDYLHVIKQMPMPDPLPPRPVPPTKPTKPTAPTPPVPPFNPLFSEANMSVVGAPVTSLGANVTSSAGTISTDGTHYKVGDVIQIEDERMQVTAIHGSTMDVLRGYGGTTAASHSASAEITVPIPMGNKIGTLITGTACQREIQIGGHLRLPSAQSAGSSSAGPGFRVGLLTGDPMAPYAPSPFTSNALGTTYPPGAEIPLIDLAGVIQSPGSQIDATTIKVVNQTTSSLSDGDIVNIAKTKQTPGLDGRTILAILDPG